MRYPIPKTTRAKLARLYYELCLVPGLAPRIIRSWADMLSRLLSSKPDQRRKLEPSDLQLPWKPLWRAMQMELWPKRRLHEPSYVPPPICVRRAYLKSFRRNVVNILLFVAQVTRIYFPGSEAHEMLSTFLPMVTKDVRRFLHPSTRTQLTLLQTILTMVPVMSCFLPLTHTHVYLPSLFKLWEAFNSSIINDWLLELCGDLSETHVAGKSGDAGQGGGADYKDVGIWSEEQWTVLASKTLGSMSECPAQRVYAYSTSHDSRQMSLWAKYE